MSQEHDRLIHILLQEVLGGQAPPDLTERIMARAFPERRSVLARAVPRVAAAVMAVAALAWLLLGKGRMHKSR